jgi:hypothetical protein
MGVEPTTRKPACCRVFGHRPRFQAEGRTLRWSCERGCGAGGERVYASEADAQRYASALDREDRDQLGRRSLLSLMPLRLARRSRERDSGAG